MPRQELTVLDGHDHSSFATQSCAGCRFNCASLVSRAQKGHGDTFAEVLHRRVSRRGLLRAGVVLSAAAALSPALGLDRPGTAEAGELNRPAFGTVNGPVTQAVGLTFQAIRPDTSDTIALAEGYTSQVVILWGDPLFPGVPALDLNAQTAALQERQFGFNADFVLYTPLPLGSGNQSDGLLWVNHEYTDGLMMFPGYDTKNPTKEQVDIELAAHGASIVQIRKNGGPEWTADVTSSFNRRITATTPMTLTGPAAGDEWLKTSADPTGTRVVGMLNNCGGGWTPWGTVLTAEENFNQYFANAEGLSAEDPRSKTHARYGMPRAASERLWEKHYDRFDIGKEPNEPFRFGWIVEVDPYDPSSAPVKRTALGRTKHEAATTVVASNGKLVVYLGDDERFDYVYKYVSTAAVNMTDRSANKNLLDEGTLYVAKYDDDGTGQWIPLVFGQGPLTAANGWRNQADVLIRTRQAADAVGATKMDRPEDIEVNPVTGVVYAVMTNNTQRGTDGRPAVDRANPRANNAYGHIIEMMEGAGNHAATTFTWGIFLIAGKPEDESTYFAGFAKDQVSAFAAPDNIAFDSRGNLWIATDGQPSALKWNDGILAVAVDGPQRGQVKQLMSGVSGCEVASLYLTADDTTLFASIQHPGEGGSLAQPTSTWPNGLARPGIIAISRIGGGRIGA